MSNCKEITHRKYQEGLDNISMMNVQAIEEINFYLLGNTGDYDDTHPDKIVSPKDELHDEYFKDKKPFAIGQCLSVIKQNGPTSNLEYILGMLSSADDMVELLWASTKLKAEL